MIEAQHWLKAEELETLDHQQWLCVLRSHKPGESFFTVKFKNAFEEDAADFLKFHIASLHDLFLLLKCSNQAF